MVNSKHKSKIITTINSKHKNKIVITVNFLFKNEIVMKVKSKIVLTWHYLIGGRKYLGLHQVLIEFKLKYNLPREYISLLFI